MVVLAPQLAAVAGTLGFTAFWAELAGGVVAGSIGGGLNSWAFHGDIGVGILLGAAAGGVGVGLTAGLSGGISSVQFTSSWGQVITTTVGTVGGYSLNPASGPSPNLMQLQMTPDWNPYK